MSMLIMFGNKSENEIKFAGDQKTVYLTEKLKEVCDKFFVEETFLEDSEEIIYRVIHIEHIQELNKEMDNCIIETIDHIKKIKGNEEKNKLIESLRDYSLLKTQIIEMLLLLEKDKDVVLALV